MLRLAISGTPGGQHHSMNVAEWIFSNPFQPDSGLMRHAPDSLKDHTIPIASPEKALFVDSAAGWCTKW